LTACKPDFISWLKEKNVNNKFELVINNFKEVRIMLLTKREIGKDSFPELYPFDFSTFFNNAWPHGTLAGNEQWVPSMDVSETGNEYKIRLEVPGIQKEDIKVELENDLLTISGEKKNETTEKDEKSFRTERTYGKFARRLRLADIDNDKISASYKNGVLSVTVSKAEAVKPRQIDIK